MRASTVIVASLVAVTSVTRLAAAQEDFTARGLRVGDDVLVTLASDEQSRGTVTGLSATSLSLDGLVVGPGDVRKVESLGDPWWNGALIGVLAGALLGQDDQFGCDDGRAARLRCARTPAIALGVLGGLLDYARVGRRTMFERGPTVTLAADTSSVHLTLRWTR